MHFPRCSGLRWGLAQVIAMKRCRPQLSGLLCAVFLFTITAGFFPALAADSDDITFPGFQDVDYSAWYGSAVLFCWYEGLMNGISETEFDPEGSLSRAMLAAVLYRIEGSPDVTGESPFLDVPEGCWFTSEIIWASQTGLMIGYGNEIFGPDDPVTRDQLVTVLWRYAGCPEPVLESSGFSDEDRINSWAVPAVIWASENGIVLAREGILFVPLEYAYRCEAAYALMNFCLYEEASKEKVAESTEAAEEPEEETGPWDDFLSIFGFLPEEGLIRENEYRSSGFVIEEKSLGTLKGEEQENSEEPEKEVNLGPEEDEDLEESEDGPSFRYLTYRCGDYAVGVDVSSFQGTIDWEEVAAAGVQFAMIRAGYRGYSYGSIYEDSCFQENIEGALDAGLEVGVYFFSQAVTVEEAIEEAEYTLQLIQDYPVTYPVVFDWERQTASSSRTRNTGYDTASACAAAFCETVSAAGYTPMYYASANSAYRFEMEYLSEYSFWLAHYTTDWGPTSFQYHFDLWQYTSSGSVPGISGDVDLDIFLL